MERTDSIHDENDVTEQLNGFYHKIENCRTVIENNVKESEEIIQEVAEAKTLYAEVTEKVDAIKRIQDPEEQNAAFLQFKESLRQRETN
jgi:type I site-specific restriction endonuclease